MTGKPKKRLLVNAPYRMVKSGIDKLHALGIGVEIFFDNNMIEDVDVGEVRNLGHALKERDIPCTVHAPFMDLSPGGFDKKIREISLDRLKRATSLANELGAIGVVCHPGFDRWRYNGNEQLWFDASIGTWSEVLKEAGPSLPVMLENIFEDEPSTLLMLFDYFKGKNLWFCFDSGHFNLFSKVSVDEWLIPLKDRLREFHLHDNHGKSDDHLPIGTGTFPFRSLRQFATQARDPLFVIEPHAESTLHESIQRAKEFLS